MITQCPKCFESAADTKPGQFCPCCGLAVLTQLPIIKMRTTTKGHDEHVIIFMGPDADNLENTGKLVLRESEWVLFYNALDNGRSNDDGCYNYEFIFERI